jgi:hypothetical protein
MIYYQLKLNFDRMLDQYEIKCARVISNFIKSMNCIDVLTFMIPRQIRFIWCFSTFHQGLTFHSEVRKNDWSPGGNLSNDPARYLIACISQPVHCLVCTNDCMRKNGNALSVLDRHTHTWIPTIEVNKFVSLQGKYCSIMFWANVLECQLIVLGKDVLAKARTGTGKTIAFLVRIYYIECIT